MNKNLKGKTQKTVRVKPKESTTGHKYKNEEFFYQVVYFITDMEDNFYEHTENFHDKDLRIARKKALEYYAERSKFILETDTFFDEGKKIVSPTEFMLKGKGIAHSVDLLFCYYDDGEEETHTLIDGGPEMPGGYIEPEVQQYRDFEKEVWEDFGYFTSKLISDIHKLRKN
jgi:hypothetical protein